MREAGRVLIAASCVVIVATSLAAQGAAVPPQDVKGWRGAEWGMTPEQVATALKQPLEEPTRNEWDNATWSYNTGEVAVGEWMARVEFTFRESRGSRQLVAIDVRFPERKWNPVSACDELTTTYGSPAFLKHGHLAGEQPFLTDLTYWRFPSTRITCQRITLPPDGVVLDVRFQPSVKPFWM